MSRYVENCDNNDTIFDDYIAIDDIHENIGLTNEINPYSMLFDIFKEKTNHLEGHCTVDDINEIRAYLNNKIAKAKKKAADKLKLSNIEDKSEFISVTLPSSKKKKTHGTKHY